MTASPPAVIIPDDPRKPLRDALRELLDATAGITGVTVVSVPREAFKRYLNARHIAEAVLEAEK